jgi:hypothetical protein
MVNVHRLILFGYYADLIPFERERDWLAGGLGGGRAAEIHSHFPSLKGAVPVTNKNKIILRKLPNMDNNNDLTVYLIH